jgi:hypothetical protein
VKRCMDYGLNKAREDRMQRLKRMEVEIEKIREEIC